MSTEDNKAIVRRYRAIHSTGNLDELDQIVAKDLISHNVIPGLPAGLEGGKMAHRGAMAAFPDTVTTTQDLIAEGDKVVERWISSATHLGDFMGMPATHKKYTNTGISIYRIAGGKIVEHWADFDQLGILQQLGLVPMPGQAK